MHAEEVFVTRALEEKNLACSIHDGHEAGNIWDFKLTHTHDTCIGCIQYLYKGWKSWKLEDHLHVLFRSCFQCFVWQDTRSIAMHCNCMCERSHRIYCWINGFSSKPEHRNMEGRRITTWGAPQWRSVCELL